MRSRSPSGKIGVIATPDPHRPSRRLQTAAAAERERLGRELKRLDGRAQALQRELEAVEAGRLELREQLSLLARFVDDGDATPFPQGKSIGTAGHLRAVQAGDRRPSATLRGSRIREVAVLLLVSSPNPRRPIHYQQWYEVLRAAGYDVEAQDPVATFLTQISRSPVVRRAGAPGVYALDHEAPHVLRQQLARLEHQLASASVSGETAEEVVAARERRAKLLTEVRSTERQLEEALRSLGSGESVDAASRRT